VLTFLDNAHGENGRAQAAHIGAAATPIETDMTHATNALQPLAAPTAVIALPVPWRTPAPVPAQTTISDTDT